MSSKPALKRINRRVVEIVDKKQKKADEGSEGISLLLLKDCVLKGV